MNNSEKALEAFKQFVFAFENTSMPIYQSKLFNKIYLHIDIPNGAPRFTYFMFDSVNNKIIAQSIIIFSNIIQQNKRKWQIGWCVEENYRGQNIGYNLAKMALAEFVYHLKQQIIGDIIEANIDINNLASIRIAQKLGLHLKTSINTDETSLNFIKVIH